MVEYPVVSEDKISIQIVGIDGKRCFFNQLKEGNQNRLDLSNLQPGIYFIRLLNDTKIMHTEKLILQ